MSPIKNWPMLELYYDKAICVPWPTSVESAEIMAFALQPTFWLHRPLVVKIGQIFFLRTVQFLTLISKILVLTSEEFFLDSRQKMFSGSNFSAKTTQIWKLFGGLDEHGFHFYPSHT